MKFAYFFFQKPNPRKKPRKQTLSSNSVQPGSKQQWVSSEIDGTEVVKSKMANNLSNRMQENSGNVALISRVFLYTLLRFLVILHFTTWYHPFLISATVIRSQVVQNLNTVFVSTAFSWTRITLFDLFH